MIEIRKGQTTPQLLRTEFSSRFRASYHDPAYALEELAMGDWKK
jgi:hypothetical protein